MEMAFPTALVVMPLIERAAPDRAGARPYHLRWRITSLIAFEPKSRGSASLPACEGGSRPLSRRSPNRGGARPGTSYQPLPRRRLQLEGTRGTNKDAGAH